MGHEAGTDPRDSPKDNMTISSVRIKNRQRSGTLLFHADHNHGRSFDGWIVAEARLVLPPLNLSVGLFTVWYTRKVLVLFDVRIHGIRACLGWFGGLRKATPAVLGGVHQEKQPFHDSRQFDCWRSHDAVGPLHALRAVHDYWAGKILPVPESLGTSAVFWRRGYVCWFHSIFHFSFRFALLFDALRQNSGKGWCGGSVVISF